MAALNIAFDMPDISDAHLPSKGRPIDLVHLARESRGDRDRELELLMSFTRLARTCLLDFLSIDIVTILGAADRLRAAAAEIGAERVEKAAATLVAKGATAANLAVASAAVLEAENFILKLCR